MGNHGSLPVFPNAVLRPVGEGLVDSRVPDIARAIHVLSGGSLTLVVRCDKRSGVQQCYDLFERDKYGRQHWVTRWSLDEVDRILEDVRASDRRAHGHVPVAQRVRDQHEARVRQKQAERDDVAGEIGERIESAWNDELGEGKVVWTVTDTAKGLLGE